MFTTPTKTKNLALLMIAVGLILFVIGFISNPDRGWASLLHNSFFFMAISLGGIFFLAIQYAAQAGWSAGILRVMQGTGSFLPYGGVILLIVFVAGGLHKNHLYHWMDTFITTEEVSVGELRDYESHMHHPAADAHADDHHGDAHAEEAAHHMYADQYSEKSAEEVIANPHYDSIIAGKTGYLNFPFFMLRAIIYLLGWYLGWRVLRRLSLKEDAEGGTHNYKKAIKYSAIFLVFFAVTSSTAAWDWIMSIDTHWFSTLFGWYVFASFFVSAVTVIAMTTVYLKGKGYLPNVNENHLHDLGKFMFAFSIFWTYLWFSQFMLIWYANIPEEVTYYMARFDQYKVPFFLMLFLNFIMPILVLMSRDAKRVQGLILFVGSIILLGHWLDFYVMIMPGTVGDNWGIGAAELGALIAFIGAFILVLFRTLSKAPLVQENHPMLKESKYHHI
jgi:hypothetical protein